MSSFCSALPICNGFSYIYFGTRHHLLNMPYKLINFYCCPLELYLLRSIALICLCHLRIIILHNHHHLHFNDRHPCHHHHCLHPPSNICRPRHSHCYLCSNDSGPLYLSIPMINALRLHHCHLCSNLRLVLHHSRHLRSSDCRPRHHHHRLHLLPLKYLSSPPLPSLSSPLLR